MNARAAIAQLGERQTEDLKVPGLIPGLGILPSHIDEPTLRQPRSWVVSDFTLHKLP